MKINLLEPTLRTTFALAGLALCLALLACCGPLPGVIQRVMASGPSPMPPQVPFTGSVAPHFTILGTYTMSYNDQVIDMAGYSKTTSVMTARLTLTPTSVYSLTGTGQITYSKSFMTNSSNCATAWQVGPLTWRVTMQGEYHQNPDGSLDIYFVADPQDGPAFPVDYTCTERGMETPFFPPADGTEGTLVNGKMDFQKIIPVSATYNNGSSIVQYHFELAPAK
jgi:hypothetical protein